MAANQMNISAAALFVCMILSSHEIAASASINKIV
jgi:hypothetical protein